MNLTAKLQATVLAARKRTGRHIGTTVKAGQIWAVELTKEGRKTVVTDLSQPGTVTDAIAFIEAL